ncbi:MULTISPECIES: DMT family transporter [Providencia]|uniref:DMT family transporter n=1 Tax=Providencia TaxID=586 RepID=UPI000838AF7D|nr:MULTISPECIES: DMT family transporter [Providencia]MBP6121336.1 DMT family transporter [Providencia sp.]NIH22775.1 DMT family transporter [Providencia heimbachae]
MEQNFVKQSNITRGWISGFIGVIIFSGSLPATKTAITGFPPDFLTILRAIIAGILGAIILAVMRQKRPTQRQLLPLAIVALGGVIGFPLLTALALQHVSSAHSIVYLGLLPLATALFGVLLAKERPRKIFWFFSVMGSLSVMSFALLQQGESTIIGDIYMIAAILLCGLGYAEGAILSKQLGSWQVICWALVLSLPLMLVLGIILWPTSLTEIPTQAWCGLIYVSLFSMLIGFFFWYRGLVEGGITGVSQLQLLQPFFGLLLSAWILNETVSTAMIASTCGVILCVAGSKWFSR